MTNEQFNLIMNKLEEHDKRFNQIDKKLEEVDKKFEQIDKKFEQIDKKFEQIDKKFEQIDKKFEEIDRRFEEIDKKFKELNNYILNLFTNIDETLSEKLDTLEQTCKSINQKYNIVGDSDLANKEMLNNHEHRIRKIEGKIFENFVAENKTDYNN